LEINAVFNVYNFNIFGNVYNIARRRDAYVFTIVGKKLLPVAIFNVLYIYIYVLAVALK
jgi:hypothetical protein